MIQNDKSQFLNQVKSSFLSGTLIRITLSKSRDKTTDLKNIYVRPVKIKSELHLNFLYRYPNKDETKNYLLDEALSSFDKYLGADFLEANLFTSEKDYILLFNKKRKARLLSKPPSSTSIPDIHHNKQKQRLIKAENNPYLKSLGITGSDDQVLKSGQKKFKQINKYIEIIESLLKQYALPKTPKIVDMGSGKGYLTFALYDHLNQNHGMNAQITGIELRPQLVEFCNNLASEAAYQGLNFMAMDIMDYPSSEMDMLIALHACDIATDIAIAKGIKSNAEIIIVAPCCHKQVRKSMSPKDTFGKMLKHGILLERQAELLTDSIRSLLMEASGYRTKVFEFISTEHTPKNMMIVGMKGKKKPSAFETVTELKNEFGIEYHYLERLLNL